MTAATSLIGLLTPTMRAMKHHKASVMNKAILFLLTFFFALPQLSIAAEEIRRFDAHITPYADGSFSVVEKIIYDFGESSGMESTVTSPNNTPSQQALWYKQRSIDVELSDVKLDGEVSPHTVTE
ncbi:MAG: hypothetical protein R3B69_00095 [Candidatus Paceibacterota bacterium]